MSVTSNEFYRGTSGYIAHYALDNALTETGAKGSTYDLTGVGSPTYTTGQIGTPLASSALSLDGSTQLAVQTSPASALLITGDITVSAWLKIDSGASFAGNRTLFYLGGDSTSEAAANNALLAITVLATTRELRVSWETGTGTDVTLNTGVLLGLNTWYHVAATRSGTTAAVYVNGAEVYSATHTVSSGGGSARLVIGAQWDGGSTYSLFWHGLVDDVAICNAAMSADDLMGVFKRGMVNFDGATGSPTVTELLQGEACKVLYYFKIEGIPYYFGSGPQPYWNLGTGYTWVNCLCELPDSVSLEVDLIEGVPRVSGCEVSLLDAPISEGGPGLIGQLLAEGRYKATGQVWAEFANASGASVDHDDTALYSQTHPAADWPSVPFYAYLSNHETVRVVAKADSGNGAKLDVGTAASVVSATGRGLFGTGSATKHAQYHVVDGTFPEISTVPFTWVGRRVRLYKAPYGNHDVLPPESSSVTCFKGRIRSRPEWRHDGKFRFPLEPLTADLDRSICWRLGSTTLSGMDLRWEGFRLVRGGATGTALAADDLEYDFGSPDVVVGASDLVIAQTVAESIGASLSAKADDANGASVKGWFDPLIERIVLQVRVTGAPLTTDSFFYLLPKYRNANIPYGFSETPDEAFEAYASQGPSFTILDGFTYQVTAPFLPFVTAWAFVTNDASGSIVPNDRIYVTDTSAMITNQGDYSSSPRAFVEYGGYLGAISSTVAGPPPYLVMRQDWVANNWLSKEASETQLDFIGRRYGEPPIPIRNVFVPNPDTDIVDTILRLLHSSGTASYTDSTYDVYAYGIGLGMDPDDIDAASFANIRQWSGSIAMLLQNLVVPEPMPIRELLSELAKVTGVLFVVDPTTWKLTAVPKQLPSGAYSVATINANKRSNPNIRATTSSDIGNAVTTWDVSMRYDWYQDSWQVQTTFDNPSAKRRLGLERKQSIQCHWLSGYPNELEAIRTRLDQFAVFHDRPWGIVELEFDRSLDRAFAAGDTVLLSASDVQDPETGRDSVTSLPAFVLDVAFSERRQTGRAKLMVWPEKAPKTWVTSALIDDTATNGGRISSGGGQAVVQVYVGKLGASEDNDFAVGDEVLITSYAGDDPTVDDSSPWTCTIQSIDTANNRYTVDDVLSGFDTTGATRYLMIDAAYTSATSSQKTDHAYVGDDSDGLINNATANDIYA